MQMPLPKPLWVTNPCFVTHALPERGLTEGESFQWVASYGGGAIGAFLQTEFARFVEASGDYKLEKFAPAVLATIQPGQSVAFTVRVQIVFHCSGYAVEYKIEAGEHLIAQGQATFKKIQ